MIATIIIDTSIRRDCAPGLAGGEISSSIMNMVISIINYSSINHNNDNSS